MSPEKWLAVLSRLTTLVAASLAVTSSLFLLSESWGDESRTSSPEEKSGVIAVLSYDGVVNPVMAEFLADGLAASKARGDAVVVIEMDTPGGLDTSMRLIIKDILASEIPVVVYVAPTGARSASAGVFITLAAHVAAMAPGTNIGAAHPVAMGGGEVDEEMNAKMTNDAAAYIRSIAEKRGRNVEWAERAVRESVSATETEALALGLIDLVVPDLPALLSALDGRTVETATGKTVLKTGGARVDRIEMDTRLKILQALSNPNVAYILMMLGIYGLIFELSSPGSILPGVVGAICLILAFYSFQTLPINYAGLLLILLAIVLFIAEIKVMSYGLLTVGGVISLVLGSLMLVKTDVPFMRVSWTVILPTAIATAAFFLLAVGMGLKAHHRRPAMGVEALVGAGGEARTVLSPRGQVFVHGELWEARAEESIVKGEPIEVTAVEGLTVVVKKKGSSSNSEARHV